MAYKNNLKQQTIVRLNQIHSTNIQTIAVEQKEKLSIIKHCDGVVTSLPRTLLTILTADCVPLLLVDKRLGIIGASHQGWKGIVGRMAHCMVQEMELKGATRRGIYAAIGPCIGMCCYEVSGERVQMYEEEFKNHIDKILNRVGSKIYLNLLAANYYTLKEAGIDEKNIDFFPFCTSCDEKRFYSYRRDGEIKGEMVSYIMKL
jgi:YfiH family protein